MAGIRLENAAAEHLFIHPGPSKKITHAIRAMDTEAEGQWVAEARAYIGEERLTASCLPGSLREPSCRSRADFCRNLIL